MAKTNRNLHHLKSARTRTGIGAPNINEGSDGDLTIRMTKSGIKLFAKFRGKWYVVSGTNMAELGGTDEDTTFGINKEKIRVDKPKGEIELQKENALKMYPWTMSSRKFSTSWGTDEKGFVIEQEDGLRSFGILENGEIVFKDTSNAGYPHFTLLNQTDAGDGGPGLNFVRNDATPSQYDVLGLGQIYFYGNNDAGEKVNYVTIMGRIEDLSDGDEEGELLLYVRGHDGSTANGLLIKANGSVDTNYVAIQGTTVLTLRGNKLMFDEHNGDTYMDHTSADVLDTFVGGVNMIKLTEDGASTTISTKGRFRLQNHDGATYDDSSAAAVQTHAQIDTAIDTAKVVYQSVTTISEAEMNALHTTEKELVAAQGSGKVIIPTSGMLFIDRDASTAQSSGSADLIVGWNGADDYATDTIYYMRRFMYNEGGDRIFHLQHYNGECGQSLTAGDDQPLTIKLSGAVTSGSIDSMKVVITYHVYDNS